MPEAVESSDLDEPAPGIGGPWWTDDGEIVAPFAVEAVDEPSTAEPEIIEVSEVEPSARPVAAAPEPTTSSAAVEPEPVPAVRTVLVDGRPVRADHPLLERPSYASSLDRRTFGLLDDRRRLA